VLGLGADRVLAQDQPLADLGFDSLMATELKQRLLREGVDLPLGRILSGPSVAEMVEMAAARQAPPAASEVVAAGPDTLWWWTHLAALVVGLALASGVWALFR
jgi:aryl carrier-like protein